MSIQKAVCLTLSMAALLMTGCGGSQVEDPVVVSRQGLDDCTALQDKIEKLRYEIQSCDPTGGPGQCGKVVDDICCPILANGGPIDEFQDTVKTFVSSCTAICTTQVCPPVVSANGACGIDGQCKAL